MSQKRIYLSPPHMNAKEREMLLAAFDSNWIAPVGPDLNAFEAEVAAYVGVAHAAALSSGTAALHLSLDLLDVGPGDEVLVSTMTFAASVNPVLYRGATPVFIDSDAATWNMDPALLDEAPVPLHFPDLPVRLSGDGHHQRPVVVEAVEHRRAEVVLGHIHHQQVRGPVGALPLLHVEVPNLLS